jgi:uncharacterized protein YggE
MNIPNKLWNAVMGVLVILTLFLFIVSFKELKSISYVGVNPSSPNVITVTGTGEAVSTPDIATFSFTVSETAKTVVEAQDMASKKINAALKAIKDSGVADKDIKTTSYNINPHYEYQNSICSSYSCPPSKSILTGYDVSQSTSVKVRDIKKAGELLATIGNQNVKYISDLNFSVDEPASVQVKAREEAIAKAQDKAKVLAKQLGVSLVKIISFSEDNGGYYPRPVYGMGGADMMTTKADIVAPEISVGEDKVTSNVTITYEIN